MFGEYAGKLEKLRATESELLIDTLRDILCNDSIPLKHTGPLTIDLQTPVRPRAGVVDRGALNIFTTQDMPTEEAVKVNNTSISQQNMQNFCDFTLTGSITDAASAPATIIRQYGQGLAHRGSDITVLNLQQTAGGYQFSGDAGSIGRAGFDSGTQWVVLVMSGTQTSTCDTGGYQNTFGTPLDPGWVDGLNSQLTQSGTSANLTAVAGTNAFYSSGRCMNFSSTDDLTLATTIDQATDSLTAGIYLKGVADVGMYAEWGVGYRCWAAGADTLVTSFLPVDGGQIELHWDLATGDVQYVHGLSDIIFTANVGTPPGTQMNYGFAATTPNGTPRPTIVGSYGAVVLQVA